MINTGKTITISISPLFGKAGLAYCLFAFLYIASIFSSSAQNRPYLHCVVVGPTGEDTLYWSPSTNACGPFENYTIWYSTTITGPYTILSTINSEAQTTDVHVGANGKNVVYYYYITASYNCGGSITMNSDTINNRAIPPPPINYVTVTDSAPVISWGKSPSPNVYGYVVYKKSGIKSYEPIDTVFGAGNTTFTDSNNDPNNGPVEYSISAMDSCQQIGLINDSSQKTIYLFVETDPCSGKGTLQWTPYLRWPDGVRIYKLFARYDGGADVLLDSTTALNDSFKYVAQATCLYIVAYRKNSAFTSTSNVVCLAPNPNHPINNLFVHTATVVSPNVNRIYYSVDSLSDVLSIYIERSEDGETYTALTPFGPPNPISGVLSYDDENALNDTRSYYYRVRMKDNCGHEVTSNFAKTILLSGFSFTNFINDLNWDNYQNDSGTVKSYTLQRNSTTGWNTVNVFNPPQNEFEEHVEGLVGDSGTLCYQVIATADLTSPTGKAVTVTSNSNILCLDELIRIGMPNAFAPAGKNNIFKPVLRFTGNKSYSFQVYDRWGGLVFTTSDFNEGWDGTTKGKPAPQGGYTYYVQIVDNLGEKTEKKGLVMLIR